MARSSRISQITCFTCSCHGHLLNTSCGPGPWAFMVEACALRGRRVAAPVQLITVAETNRGVNVHTVAVGTSYHSGLAPTPPRCGQPDVKHFPAHQPAFPTSSPIILTGWSFTDKETKAERVEGTCPRSHSWKTKAPAFEPVLSLAHLLGLRTTLYPDFTHFLISSHGFSSSCQTALPPNFHFDHFLVF